MKKIITILILLQFIYSASNAQIKLIGNITTNGKASYPTHIDSLGKGGMMVMPTLGSRDSIPSLRRKFGMLVYVQENDSLYKLKNTASAKKYTDSSDWLSIGLSSSEDVDKFLKYVKTSDSLFIIGNTTIDSNLYVKGGLRIGGKLELDSRLVFNDSLTVTRGARIDSSLLVKGKIFANDSLVANSRVYALGKVQLDSTLTVNKVTTIRDSLLAKANVVIDSNLYVKKDLEVKGNLIVNTGLIFNDSLIVTSGARIDSGLLLKRNLNVDGVSILNDSLIVKNISILSKIQNDSSVIAAKLRGDSTTINSSLVDSSLILNTRINTKVNTLNGVVQNTLTVNGKATITDSLTVRGNTAISGNLTVKGTNILSKLTTDSTTILTRLIDSSSTLNNRINSKVNISDTATMLDNYRNSINDLSNSKVNSSDTAAMLNSRFARDTVSISNRIDVLANSTSSEKIKFTKDFPVRIATGKTFGKYANGSTIPATGKTLDELLTDITTEVIRPTYTGPSVTVGSPNAGTFEVGANLGTINLTSTFTQRDAGAITNTKYQKSGTDLAGTTDIISSLTTPLQYTAVIQYAKGSVKLNNIDVPDSTGIIQAGSITSALTTLFTPAAKKYYGSSLSNNITDADLLAGSSEFVSNNASILKSSFTIPISGGSKYIYYAYPVKYIDNITSYPTSIAIWVGGFESTGSFTKTIKSVTNAQNFTQDYYIYVWKNTSNADITNIEVK